MESGTDVDERAESLESECNLKKIQWAMQGIIGEMQENLTQFAGPKARKVVLYKVWEHLVIALALHKDRRKSSLEIMSGLI